MIELSEFSISPEYVMLQQSRVFGESLSGPKVKSPTRYVKPVRCTLGVSTPLCVTSNRELHISFVCVYECTVITMLPSVPSTPTDPSFSMMILIYAERAGQSCLK